MGAARWRFWIDQGGTFTDVVAVDPDGARRVHKLLSRNPGRYRHAPLQGIRDLLGLAPGAPIPADTIEHVRLGTTVATNALLERHGEPCLLLITEGFEDLLEIGYQARPELFALRIVKPEALPARVVGVRERLGADGGVLRSLDEDHARRALREARAAGIASVAVCLLHAYLEPCHELRLGALAREVGFEEVSLSHQVARERRAVGRGDTTCVDAYLTPLLRRYLEEVASELPTDCRLSMMQSSGGLADAQAFTGKNAVLSGPAGGLVACAHVAESAGFPAVIGLDMGGTSTDVSRYAGTLDRVHESVVAGVRLKAPMLDIRTVAAGGGSRLTFEGGRFQVGPESAGADPGPACYRRGGPLAVTDANLVLGRVQPAYFPACFGPDANRRLDPEASRAGFEEVAARVLAESGQSMSVEEVAHGFVTVANAAMAKPVRELSAARGYDVREHALLAFGGAAAQHACALADSLGMQAVLVHPLGGVMSAYGMGLAARTHEAGRTALLPWDERAPEALEPAFEELEAEVRAVLEAAQDGAPSLARHLELRYQGVDETLEVALDGDVAAVRAAFEREHSARYGFHDPEGVVEVEAVRVRGEVPGLVALEEDLTEEEHSLDDHASIDKVEVWFAGQAGLATQETPVFRLQDLGPGGRLTGPALVIEDVSTIVVDPGWVARRAGDGTLVVTRGDEADAGPPAVGEARDPVTLELFHSLFMSAAEQMGRTLERVAHSTNIKERLDFSCALFDAAGELVANAPHIPVHLGAMGATVRAVRDAVEGTMAAGDVFVSNDPYHGGSHLPDVTVVTPVFDPGGAQLRYWVASRGHHADIGGITPGSMPPFSTSIDQEGVRLHAFPLVRAGRFDEAGIRAALGAGPYPARNVAERLSDLRAQVAANQAGVRELRALEERYGAEVVAAQMGHVLANGEEAVRALLTEVADGERVFLDHLDDGARVQVTLRVTSDAAVLDFTGTDPQRPGNLNAPRAVVEAAALYVLRCLTPREIPLNGGCLRPIELVVPEGTLLNPRVPAAVVGGNVETSQRVVDVLFGAFGRLAASQGTMNNLTFGTEDYGYYETICGGAGAGLGFDGASAVHTHMTNTRITDPEVLEHRYPVRVRRFSRRRGSGGPGVYRGGDGVVRELEILEPMSLALLSERRGVAPFGLHGAGSARRGHNRLVRAGRGSINLPGKARMEAEAGDLLSVSTPGGGGYDPTPAEWAAMAPAEVRRLARLGRLTRSTAGMATGYLQLNLIVLPPGHGDAFADFCAANPQACPLFERLAPGAPLTREVAPGADVRTDVPRYRVHRLVDGQPDFEEARDLAAVFADGCESFLLGCSFSFEGALATAGHVPRHVELGRNVPMFRTSRPLTSAGPFGGELVVSMRPYRPECHAEVAAITARYPRTHGAPVQLGEPEDLGITDLSSPDFGDAVDLRPGEEPVFWACGVTSQEACLGALRAGALPWFASHAPGFMLVADRLDSEFEEEPA